MSTALDAFKAETKAFVDQYLTHKIKFPDCQILLAYAFTKAKRELGHSEYPALTDIVIANHARWKLLLRERDAGRDDKILFITDSAGSVTGIKMSVKGEPNG